MQSRVSIRSWTEKRLSLRACAERRKLEVQKDDTLKKYFKEGKNKRDTIG